MPDVLVNGAGDIHRQGPPMLNIQLTQALAASHRKDLEAAAERTRTVRRLRRRSR